MRGLPPPPDDFILWEIAWEIDNAALMSSGFYIFAPGAGAADAAVLESIASGLFFFALPELLSVLGSDVTASAFRLRTWGSRPFTLLYAPAPNNGALGSSAPNNAALVMTWRGATAGRGQEGHSYLPLANAHVDPNGSTLTSVGWSQCQSAARGFVQQVNAQPSPDGASCVAAIVHRSRAGTPFALAQWEPVELGDASPRVGTLRRRVRKADPFSSPF